MNSTSLEQIPGDALDVPALPSRSDLAGGFVSFGLIWGVPIAALVLGGIFDVEAFLWPPALAVMGIGCLANAFRCGRLHCYITGPFFLIAAVVSLLHGGGLVPLGPGAWTWIGNTVFAGGLVLTCAPEMIWGRYVRR